jgi:hypothetical protein
VDYQTFNVVDDTKGASLFGGAPTYNQVEAQLLVAVQLSVTQRQNNEIIRLLATLIDYTGISSVDSRNDDYVFEENNLREINKPRTKRDVRVEVESNAKLRQIIYFDALEIWWNSIKVEDRTDNDIKIYEELKTEYNG